MLDDTGLDSEDTLDAIFQFAIASEMCPGVDHKIKYISPQNLT
jgi:hypothetical protein